MGSGGWSLEVRTEQFNLNVTSSHTADRVTYLLSSLSKTDWVVIAAYDTQSHKDKVSPNRECNTHARTHTHPNTHTSELQTDNSEHSMSNWQMHFMYLNFSIRGLSQMNWNWTVSSFADYLYPLVLFIYYYFERLLCDRTFCVCAVMWEAVNVAVNSKDQPEEAKKLFKELLIILDEFISFHFGKWLVVFYSQASAPFYRHISLRYNIWKL